MLVRQLMQTEVITLASGSTLDLAEDLMRVDRVHHLPVLSGDKLVGLVTERDLLRATVSTALDMDPGAQREWLRRIPVDQVMATEVLTAHPDAPIGGAVEMMLNERIGCLPVVEDGRLVGLLSETDCLRYLGRLIQNEEERRLLY